LLHFHLGSQINNIRNIKHAIIELVRVYVEMQRLGAGLQMIDVGGGLGVDYDGSKTDFGSSINYGLQEYANDVVFHVKEICDEAVLNLFSLGYCSLEHRSVAERLFFAICAKVLTIIRRLDYVPDEFEGLEAMLSDTYFCNYSIFQSMPDSWAIDQLFPIMPIHRLGEEPTCRGILADITCASGGKAGRFIDRRRLKRVLAPPPHAGSA